MLIQLILIQIITFAVIIFVLKKLLYTETMKEANRLRKLKDEFFIKEKELQTKADMAQKEVETLLAGANEKARSYRDSKEKEADELKQAIIARAREQAEEMVKAAVNSKEKIREEIEHEMKKKIPEMAVRIVKEAMPSAALRIVHAELLVDVVDKIKKLDKGIFKAKVSKAELFSAYPLKASDKGRIASAISGRIGNNIKLTDKEDKGLVAGVVVKMGALVIDGSLENRLSQVQYEQIT